MEFRKFQSLCLYVGFDGAAAKEVGALCGPLKPFLEPIVDDFYRAISRHPSAREAIRGGPAQVARLKGSLQSWLLSLLSGVYDERFVQQHSRIGHKHVEINLPQELMFTAMSRIRTGLMEAVQGVVDPERVVAASRALDQVLDLALSLMLDTYRESLDQRIRLEVDRSSAQTRLVRRYEELSEKLKDSERKTRSIVDGLPAFVAAMDEGGRISFWNRQLETVTGFAASEMLGTAAEGIFDSSGSVRLALKGGGHRLARWQHTTVAQEEGAGVTYALGVDVTEEAEMQRRATRAERLAAVGTLATGLAHEVRNPLNSATLQLQTLRRRLLKGTRLDSLEPIVERVEEEIGRLDALVGDFLAFARPRALTLARTHLNALVESLAALLQPELSSQGIEFSLQLDDSVGEVNVDEGQIRQVVHNLVRNAAQAMENDGTVTIRTVRADERARVLLEVGDTGPGFDAEAPIFDAFFTTKSSGTGLGLAIVHRIVQEHGGTIAADSEPGATRFQIYLPQPASS